MSKYKVGQTFKDAYSIDLTYTILAVSPEIDYQGEYSYFVEMSDGKDKWYSVVYDSNMKDDEELCSNHEEMITDTQGKELL